MIRTEQPRVRRHSAIASLMAAIIACTSAGAIAQELSKKDDVAQLSARAAMREGNRRLQSGAASDALTAYQRAAELAPEAREVKFVEGLAQFDLKDFDKARPAFEKAMGAASDALADDALYSLGTCDHMEALQRSDDPEAAMGLLESAMKRYHNVLEHRPDHKAARDANYKAATMWRQMKQMQQQQKQESDEDQKKKDGDEQQDSDKKQNQDGEKKEQDKDEKNQSQDQEDKQDQDQQQKNEQKQSDESKSEQDEQQKQAAKQEQVSKEQAQRKLREMMQALRDRMKSRRKMVEQVPLRATDKDW